MVGCGCHLKAGPELICQHDQQGWVQVQSKHHQRDDDEERPKKDFSQHLMSLMNLAAT